MLEDVLKCSESLSQRVRALLAHGHLPTERRAAIVLGMCLVTLQHWDGMRLLLMAGLDTPAMAIVRVQFESTVRAIWLLHAASDDWVEKFTGPAPADSLAEPVLGPNVDAMLVTIARCEPPHIEAALRNLKQATWVGMNSYVHGGIRAVAQAVSARPEPQLRNAVLNSNGLALLAANVALMSIRSHAVDAIGQIQKEFASYLPPVNPS